MPRRDGTGPMGQGAMTGRGLGNCNDGEIMNSDFGMGRRFGRGMGCSNGRRFNRAKGMGIGFGFGYRNAGMDREYLTEQKSMLQKTLDAIEKQLENLKD
ncbi:MAG: DUF5320 domain-containing protein [Clostridiales bacterium]|nr:DUF5320 domain-containing protein [Clostridiales bacterium]